MRHDLEPATLADATAIIPSSVDRLQDLYASDTSWAYRPSATEHFIGADLVVTNVFFGFGIWKSSCAVFF